MDNKNVKKMKDDDEESNGKHAIAFQIATRKCNNSSLIEKN